MNPETARIRRLLAAGDMTEREIATACRVTIWRVREVRRELAEPAGIARLRTEIADLEAQEREHGSDRTRALLLDGKRRTLALLERTWAAVPTPPGA